MSPTDRGEWRGRAPRVGATNPAGRRAPWLVPSRHVEHRRVPTHSSWAGPGPRETAKGSRTSVSSLSTGLRRPQAGTVRRLAPARRFRLTAGGGPGNRQATPPAADAQAGSHPGDGGRPFGDPVGPPIQQASSNGWFEQAGPRLRRGWARDCRARIDRASAPAKVQRIRDHSNGSTGNPTKRWI